MEDKSSESKVEASPVPVKKGGSNTKRILIIVGIAVLVIGVGLGGYFYGVSVGRGSFARNPQFARGQFGQQGANQTPQAGRQGGGQPGGGVSGSIASIDATTLTVTTRSGNVQVTTTDTTLIEKYATVGVQDLAVGDQITVMGSTNADGSVTARSIQTIRALGATPTAQP